jgi:phenylacetic acid degradation operon negative regulatory protein
MRAVDDWRRLPLSDPGLPRELLGPDWAGEEAGAAFEAIIAAADTASLAHVARHARP